METTQQHRRIAIILAASQAIVGSAAPIALSVGGLAGYDLLEADKSLATAPVTGYNVGVALGALPAAAHPAGRGSARRVHAGHLRPRPSVARRRPFSIFQSNFWLFALSLAIIGVGGAFVQQFRFAAADNAPPAFKARAISFVLAGGVITAVLGPQIVIFRRHALVRRRSFCRIVSGDTRCRRVWSVDPVDCCLAALRVPVVQAAEEGGARPLREIALQPRFFVGPSVPSGPLR